MKNPFQFKFTALLFVFFVKQTSAQTTAMDFTKVDCNSTGTHNLYSDLNSGKVVIIEYFMLNCTPCVFAGQKLESLKTNLLSQYPGKIKSYAFGFSNTYSCSSISNWVQTNGFTSIPCDSGGTQVAFYGGMGMPTIVIAGGTNHQLLGSPYVGFVTNDTTQMGNDIRNFLNGPTGLEENSVELANLTAYPNPANTEFILSLTIQEKTDLVFDVLDLTGKTILSSKKENIDPGTYRHSINSSLFENGNYLIRVKSNNSVLTKKLTIIH